MTPEQRQRQQAANRNSRLKAMKVWEPRKAEIEWLYHTRRWSQTRVAEYYDANLVVLQRAMRYLGIKSRGRGRPGSEHHQYKDGRSTRLYRKLVVKDVCGNCGATERLSVHHKNDDHYDNRVENLQILCESCHISLAKKAWWAAKKAGLPTPKGNGPVGWTREAKSRQS